MNDIKTAEFVKSSSKVEECPDQVLPEYAFIGRSNVGKSSLINHLTSRTKLAKVSSKPGKTQLINHFLIDDQWYLVDLPGYGWAKVSKTMKAQWKKMIEGYFSQRSSLTMVFILIDSRHDPQQNDIDFVNTIGQAGIPLALIFTKTDKNGMPKSQASAAKFLKRLKMDWDELPPHFLSSTVTGHGKDKILNYIREVNGDMAVR